MKPFISFGQEIINLEIVHIIFTFFKSDNYELKTHDLQGLAKQKCLDGTYSLRRGFPEFSRLLEKGAFEGFS